MRRQSLQNKKAWENRAYDWWLQYNGTPEQAAADMCADPGKWVRKHLGLLGEVKGHNLLIPLGSNGRKAIPLALLGANVTIVDISLENERYALELAEAAGVEVEYIVADYAEYDNIGRRETFDIVYMEGGILHYFGDLSEVFGKTQRFLKSGGRFILNDFHPFRKCLNGETPTAGDYFDTGLHNAPVAYEGLLEGADPSRMPKCLLRYWTIGEIVTSVAGAGFAIREMREVPRPDDRKVPGEFTIVALKQS